MRKHCFEFDIEHYQYDQGCDCCEPVETVVYNEVDGKILGSCFDEFECYARTIETVLNLDAYSLEQEFEDYSLEQLINRAESLEIKIQFNYT